MKNSHRKETLRVPLDTIVIDQILLLDFDLGRPGPGVVFVATGGVSFFP